MYKFLVYSEAGRFHLYLLLLISLLGFNWFHAMQADVAASVLKSAYAKIRELIRLIFIYLNYRLNI